MPAYYKLVHTPRRMLHASEIASALDVYTEQYKPHAKFAAALVKSMSDQDEIYSKTRNGLTRVYDMDDSLEKEITSFISSLDVNRRGRILVDGKVYNVVLGKKWENMGLDW